MTFISFRILKCLWGKHN